MKKITFLFIFAICFFSSISSAQDLKSNVTEPIKIPRINSPVTLDGMSNEAAWEGIEPLPMVMHIPNFGNAPSERTEILIAYDDDYLYGAARFYDSEPSKIQSLTKQRDSGNMNNDWFGFYIDTFNDNENALSFFTSPTGLRTDLTIFNDAQGWNYSWNTFWDAEAISNDEGWFAEMRIPFSSLRFQERDGQVVMGIIALRLISRKNEMVIFPAISPDRGGVSYAKPSQAQDIIFEGISSRKPLYITPYTLGGLGKSFELNEDETAYVHRDDTAQEIGLDVKYGLTNNLTLDVTVNTDFAQVDADDQRVNLTRYSLFFPEKRLFFQERSSNFDFNLGQSNRLFYSRRIGLFEGESVRIYGGARVVGRIGPWDVGFLSMQTEQIKEENKELPSENSGVLRLRRQVINPYSYVGGIITNRMGVDGTYNTAYGFDGIFRLFEDDYLTLRWAETFENDRDNNPASLAPVRIFANWERRTYKGLGFDLDFSRSGADYNPGLGYERREDYTRFGNRVLYGWLPGEQSSMLMHWVFVDGFIFLRNSDGSTESAEIGPGWNFTTKSDYYGNFEAKMYHEDVRDSFEFSDDAEVPVGQYTYYGFEGEFGTPASGLNRIYTSINAGSFYDGWRASLSIWPTYTPFSDLELSGMYQFNRVEFPDRNQQFTAHIGRLRVLSTLTIKHSVIAFIQYNSAADVIITNIRFRYNPREGNDLYIVYDEGLNTDRRQYDPIRPVYGNRTVMLKYSYTFNL